jgi:hypothetical protein
MRSKRMLIGAAVVGCLAATMTSGAHAQEANTTDHLKARAGQQPAANTRADESIRRSQGTVANGQISARASNGMSANGQVERRSFGNQGRVGESARVGRIYSEHRGIRNERGAFARVSEERYGRGWRSRAYAGATFEGGYRRERLAYRDRAVGVAAADYGYRTRRLYAYAPSYEVDYATRPYYTDAQGYDVVVNTGPYYTPGWNVAYASPYYGYAPGVSFGIGVGPVGIGVGPAWSW